MILVRIVFRAKQGKINQLVARMKEVTQHAPNRPMILTDLSGPMNTMVMESRHASLAAYEQFRAELFRSEAFQAGEAQNEEIIDSGHNEFYTIEQE
jgi:hypothetical protein